jgi:hypothetical protein
MGHGLRNVILNLLHLALILLLVILFEFDGEHGQLLRIFYLGPPSRMQQVIGHPLDRLGDL